MNSDHLLYQWADDRMRRMSCQDAGRVGLHFPLEHRANGKGARLTAPPCSHPNCRYDAGRSYLGRSHRPQLLYCHVLV